MSQLFLSNDCQVEEESGGRKQENPPPEKSRCQPQIWPRPQNRPPPQQHPNQQQFQQEIYNQGQNQDQRKSVTFGPPIRNNFLPENRPPQLQQGVVIRRPSPWAVVRAKLPTGDNVPVLRPGINNEHFIQRMQNPEAARPPSRPPMSRPGSQESVRTPYIQRSDSVVGRPPTSPRPSASPIRPSSRTSSMSSKDEDDDVNDIRSVSRPPSGQKSPGLQSVQAQHNPIMAQSPIIQIANHPPNMQPPQMMNQPHRIQQSPVPTSVQHQAQHQVQHQVQHQSAMPQTQAQIPTQPMTQPQNKPQVPNQPQGPPVQVPMPSQPVQQGVPPQQNQTPTPHVQGSPATLNQISAQNSVQSSPPSSGPQTPVPASPSQPSSTQNSVPPSPVGARRPASARNTIQPSPTKAQQQKQDGPTSIKDTSQEIESAPETKMSQDKINHNDTIKELNKKTQENSVSQEKTVSQEKSISQEKSLSQEKSMSQEKPQHKPPIVADATLKRPMDFKGPSQMGKGKSI